MAVFYTGRGDEGATGLLGPGRVPKYDLRIETLGALEETSAALGLARSLCRPDSTEWIVEIQRTLYRIMA
ncbi:MAG TPA: ATP:cob(I)alamin adenosyltransferase, partial [Anaerolineaceae bacterium]|nr:ATP:cob(I)alamin adenosyltransferase [Anaerolineaceae bacterium]